MWLAELVKVITTLWNAILYSITNQLSTNPADWGGGAAWDIAGAIQTGIRGIAYGLMVLFWAMSFFRYVDDIHKVDAKEMAMWILRFVIIYALLEGSMYIMEAVLGIATETNSVVLEHVQINFENMPQDVLAAVQDINNIENIADLGAAIVGFFEAIPISLFYVVIMCVVLGCGVGIIISIYLRFFKLYIYTAISPLPLSTFTGYQSSEIGRHFLKSWASVCLEVVVISISIAVFNATISNNDTLFSIWTTSAESDNISALWNTSLNWGVLMLIKTTLLLGVVKGAGRITDKMIGV